MRDGFRSERTASRWTARTRFYLVLAVLALLLLALAGIAADAVAGAARRVGGRGRLALDRSRAGSALADR